MERTLNDISDISFSVAIATYRRPELLKRCLDHIDVTVVDGRHDIMILDNACDPLIEELVNNYNRKDFRYLLSPKIGLSATRNLALDKAKYNWIIYLDDDAFVNSNFIKAPQEFIKSNPNIGCFGGEIHSVFDSRPWWLPIYFGSRFYKDTNPFVSENFQINGGLMAINRENTFPIRFDENYGMKGDKIAYGEETDFVTRINANGVQIGHTKDWYVDHLVRPEKTSISWLLESWRGRARDGFNLFPISPFKATLGFLRTLLGFFLIMPVKAIIKLKSNKAEAHIYIFRYLRNLIIYFYLLMFSFTLRSSIKSF